ncbi:restriction endonuclease [Pseudoalteromonas sp. MMG005]|nr:restriction endonuclease [Pseudoalteromonas sp. MMG005]
MVNLCNLSHIDFEDLCIDIVQKETGEKFSSFGAGPDGGIDGRHSKSDKLTILQCKHYTKSRASDLLRTARQEVLKLNKINPARYLFFTSYTLTPNLSDQLTDIFRPYICSSDDIWGAEDIRAALRRHPDILKSHFKLWLTDSAILDRVLHSGLENYTQITKDEIADESKVYVRNPSYDDAFLKLESKNTLIISGAPGVGKTTLAKMVCYQYLKDGWSFCAINSLEQGYAKINQGSQTVFFFDDFLGKIELNRNALVNNESALATFMKRVQKSENAKFIFGLPRLC